MDDGASSYRMHSNNGMHSIWCRRWACSKAPLAFALELGCNWLPRGINQALHLCRCVCKVPDFRGSTTRFLVLCEDILGNANVISIRRPESVELIPKPPRSQLLFAFQPRRHHSQDVNCAQQFIRAIARLTTRILSRAPTVEQSCVEKDLYSSNLQRHRVRSQRDL